MDLSEKETREQIIDPWLKSVGWKDEYVKKEINSVKSDFKAKQYNPKVGEGKEEGRFIDYLLLDEHKYPLALIEAKRFSLDAEKGSIQATTYQKDIEAQTKVAIPIFLTNGKKWYMKEKGYPTREVSGPLSQRDLMRRAQLNQVRTKLSSIGVDPKILNRSRNVEIVKQVLDHFEKGNRKALINMATGTGKTRVAMALIKILITAGYVRNVLFVVDRISLGNQAFQNFDNHLKGEPKTLLNEMGDFDPDKRIYVSTVQTLMSKDKDVANKFQKFSPGFFDLIVFDEAHRSYYDKNNLIFQYFDSLKIGLTATPSKGEAKNTFDLFDCPRGEPTVRYDYDEAVRDGVLVPYKTDIITTQVLEFGIEGAKLDDELKTALIQQEENPEVFQTPGSRFEKFFTDRKTNELIVMEFMNKCYKDEGDKPCKSIFFCASVKHAEALEKVFRDLYPKLAENDVSVIVSNKDRYMDEVRRFIKDSSPRIALSVGVLDTGIDIPEIMNLVFVKPVLSQTRFWQMLGRGTRNFSACNNKSWLPIKDGVHVKEDFNILDFTFGGFSNIKYHQLEITDKSKATEDMKVRIFDKEVELLKKKLAKDEKEIVERHIIDSVNKIDTNSFIVKPRANIIKKVVSKKFDLEEHIKALKDEIAPLIRFTDLGDGRVQTFISHCVDLFKYVKEKDTESILDEREFMLERIENVWSSNLQVVKNKQNELIRAMQPKFWHDLTFADIDFLIREIAPLMKFYEPERKKIIRVDAPDAVLSVEHFSMPKKEDPILEEIKKNPLMQKMAKEGVSWKELAEIEEQLRKKNPSWTIDNIQKIRKIDFVLFLRDILSLKNLPDPQEMIKSEFEKLIVENNKEYNSEQIRFLRLLEKFFAYNKHLTPKDLTQFPLSEERPLDKFSPEQLRVIIKDAEKIRIK